MRPRMRLAGPLLLLGLAALAAAAGPGAWHAAGLAERLVAARAGAALAGVGADWARVEADGLRLRLSGAWPDAQARAAALGALARAVPLASLADASAAAPRLAPAPGAPAGARVAAARPPDSAAESATEAAPDPDPAAPAAAPAPEPPLTLVRDGDAVTLAGAAHPDLVAALRADLAGRAGAPALGDGALPRAALPDAARLALARAALGALMRLPRARAVIRPGVLSLSATAADAGLRAEVEAGLRAAMPAGAVLLLDISVPPPTLSPFRFGIALYGDGPTLLSCDMPSADARAEARRGLARLFDGLGDPAAAPCRVGVGVPSADWVRAALAGAEALHGLGAGRFELEDSDARLVAGPETRPRRFDAAARALAAAMPEGFSLRLTPPPPGPRLPEAEAGLDGPPLWFAARREADGTVRLTGAAPDAPTRDAVAAFARARFGVPAVDAALEMAETAAPPAWRRAALAGLDALVPLDDGALRFDGARLTVTGRALRPGAAREAAEALAPLRAAGVETRAEVTVDLPALAERLPLPPETCLARLKAAVAADPIGFDPGEAVITDESRDGLDRLAALLDRCAGLVVEISGHTDSQGRESTNLALSRARAAAVVDALFARGVSLSRMTAEGYGEDRPVASNATEEGRARNRRIEFADARAPEDDA